MINVVGEINKGNASLLKLWRVVVPFEPRIFRKHSHTQFEISLVENGSGEYKTKNKVYKMNKDDIFVFSSNEIHCITSTDKDGLVLLNMHFEPRYLWGSQKDSLSSKHINFCFSHSQDFENKIDKAKTEHLRDLIYKIYYELDNKKSEYQLLVKTYLNELVVSLIRDYNYQTKEYTFNDNHIKSIKNTITYIDNHINEDLSLKKLALMANMTPSYFSSFFHKTSGITLWNYIESKRIENVIQLLTDEENGYTMLEIATMCGFNNTANFNKTFKKQTGFTPKQYKQNKNSIIQ